MLIEGFIEVPPTMSMALRSPEAAGGGPRPLGLRAIIPDVLSQSFTDKATGADFAVVKSGGRAKSPPPPPPPPPPLPSPFPLPPYRRWDPAFLIIVNEKAATWTTYRDQYHLRDGYTYSCS